MSRFNIPDIKALVEKFASLRITVVGDVIVDEYIECEALGMSQENPTIVVSPISRQRFLGGAGIVAAHAANLGATVRLYSAVGKDDHGDFSGSELMKWGICGIKKCVLGHPSWFSGILKIFQ